MHYLSKGEVDVGTSGGFTCLFNSLCKRGRTTEVRLFRVRYTKLFNVEDEVEGVKI